MLKKINIKQKELTPLVCVDKKNTMLVFKGVCVPENTYEFFNPIFKWIDEYSLKPIKEFKFQFELDYFNTSSSRMILELMKRIQKIPDQYIEWLLFEDDEDINEVVNDYNELLGGGIIIKIKQRDFAVS